MEVQSQSSIVSKVLDDAFDKQGDGDPRRSKFAPNKPAPKQVTFDKNKSTGLSEENKNQFDA